MVARKLFPLCSAIFAMLVLSDLTSLRANPEDPWTLKQTVQPADFVKELQQEKDPYPTVIYVGVKTLYEGAHIPGAAFYGPGSTEQGLAELRKFASTLPKNSDVVLYCGCCPLEKCPNLRPAFTALKDIGFARLRVLILPTSFNTDWVEQGLPVHKGEKP
jgi:thiosulfate/3-mercaptopyruvate sulfurtransferase